MAQLSNTSDTTPSGMEAITRFDEQEIRNLIHTIRGVQVILDSDLARLYQVETGAINRAAKRNEARFPEDFRFQISKEELEFLRCQIGIFAGQDASSSLGRTYLPYVYTEQGVAMLSALLRSAVAVETSVRIMRAFVEMRRLIASSALMFEQIRSVELRQLEFEKSTDERFERVFDYMGAHETVGASLKDTGKRTFAITRIEDEALTRGVLERLETAKDNTMH